MVFWTKYDKNIALLNKADIGVLAPAYIQNIFDHKRDKNIMKRPVHVTRMSPIIVTLGRTCKTIVDMRNLLEAGMNIARISFSWLTREDNLSLLDNLKEAARICCEKHNVKHWPVATAIDLRSGVIISGLIKPEINKVTINLDEYSEVILTCALSMYDQCDRDLIYVDCPHLAHDMEVGKGVVIDGGEILLTCTEIVDETSIKCVVTKGGKLGSMNLVSLRGVMYSAPELTHKDEVLINFAIDYNIDILIVPYVRNVGKLAMVKQKIGDKKNDIKIFAQICTEEGLNNLEDIIDESDAIVLGREFISHELLVDRTFLIQKHIAACCQKAGKPMFISGNILPSMQNANKLIMHEASDINNAMLDGVDGFMIKDLQITMSAHNHLKTVLTLAELCKATEPVVYNKENFWRLCSEMKIPLNAAEACAATCVLSARSCHAAAIFLLTATGRTVKVLSRLRPHCLVLAITTNEKLYWLYRVPWMISTIPPLNSTNSFAEVTDTNPRERICFLANRISKSHSYLPKPDGLDTQSCNWQKQMENRIQYAVHFALNKGIILTQQAVVLIFKASMKSAYCDTVQIRHITSERMMLWESCE